MIRTQPAMSLRKNLGEILNEVEYRKDTVIITRGGKPSAAIIDMQLFDKIRLMHNRFKQLTNELQDAFQGNTEEQNNALIEEALAEIRKK